MSTIKSQLEPPNGTVVSIGEPNDSNRAWLFLCGILKLAAASAFLGLIGVGIRGEGVAPTFIFLASWGVGFLFLLLMGIVALSLDYRAKVALTTRYPGVARWGPDGHQVRRVTVTHPPPDLDQKITLVLEELVETRNCVSQPRAGIFRTHRPAQYQPGRLVPERSRSRVEVRKVVKADDGAVELEIESVMDEPAVPGVGWLSLGIDLGRSIENVEKIVGTLRDSLMAGRPSSTQSGPSDERWNGPYRIRDRD